ncbi:Glucosamine-phosphate N-acetyltransferase-like protein, partial [Borealophlyctis nickersoniae]
MATEEPLFNPVYISPEVQSSLNEGFVVRPLAPGDYEKGGTVVGRRKREESDIAGAARWECSAFPCSIHFLFSSGAGFLETLSQLTTVGTMSKGQFMERYAYLKSHNYEYFTIVIEDTTKKRIVGAGTIFVERKFVHGAGL